MQKLSVLIFSRNDIPQAVDLIKSIYKIADQVVLVDSSDAKNRKALRSAAAGLSKLSIFHAPALGYPDPLFMYGIGKCKHGWILRLDVDERLSKQLMENIGRLIRDARCSAFALKRYEEVRSGKRTGFFTWQIRIFRKGMVRFKGIIHEQPEVHGRLRRIEDNGIYLEHVVELMHHQLNMYNMMDRYERFSYASYNAKVVDYLSKLRMGDNRDSSGSPSGRAVHSLLNFYEAVTFRGKEKEVSNFDYFMLRYIRNLTYKIKEGRPSGVFEALPETLGYIKQMKGWRAADSGNEEFEIAKMINKEGVTGFLDLENEETIRMMDRKYAGKKQGVELTFRLLRERYARIKD
ncbi:MAG: hypothetical protein KGH72_02690 [Candidatus Micrarchaeota archaeon]|nr:hypothetical protein [Candidatus Micrarchaeota archaeon]